MKKRLMFLAILLASLSISSLHSQSWSMKKARIMSPWAEKINPKKVLDEYPRPQLVRSNWYNLNGIWDFTEVKDMSYKQKQTFDQKILVPFAPESAISGVMQTDHQKNKGKVFLYNRKFSVPSSMKDKRVMLHFGAVDWKCVVYVNGKEVGTHTGGFDPFSFDITDALEGQKQHELQVFVQDFQEDGGGLHGKQKTNEKTIWYTPVTGIWQTVWLEGVNETHISSLKIVPNIDTKTVKVSVLSDKANNATATILVKDNGKIVAQVNNVPTNTDTDIQIENMKLWSPDSPFLYDLEVKLNSNGKEVDKVDSYFGMRKISVGEFNGKPCMMLNNEYSFHYGPLDQGFWPDGIYTAPSDEALKYDLEVVKKFGMNMSRKHIKIEPARWYYHCDKMGILVWQDIPNAGHGKDGKIRGEGNLKLRDNFHDEMERIVKSLENHPSIVMWVVYNESWGQPGQAETQQGVDLAKKLDPNRLISVASGWNDYEFGDIKDTHWYPKPNMLPNPMNKRISVCGEYGGITLMVDNHQWKGGSDMKYTQVYSSEEFKNLFNDFTKSIQAMQANGLNGAVYTQLTDVEDEENGLMTYDRKVIKVNESQIAEIRKEIEKNYTHTAVNVIPTSAVTSFDNKWNYVVSKEPLKNKDWTKTNFDDSSWYVGLGGFGKGRLQGANEMTEWSSPYIYMRRIIDFEGKVTASNLNDLRIQVFYDEDCEVYINGVLAAKMDGYTNRYEFVEISDQAKKAIKLNGKNTVAVSCKNMVGNQYIDLGFTLINIPRESIK